MSTRKLCFLNWYFNTLFLKNVINTPYSILRMRQLNNTKKVKFSL